MTEQERLDNERKRLFHLLGHEVMAMFRQYHILIDLYHRSQKRLELLDTIAVDLFWDVRWALWDSFVLHACKLTDKESSCGFENLTLASLIDTLPNDTPLKVREELIGNFEHLRKQAKKLSVHRNKHIAHLDFKTFSVPKCVLPDIPPQETEDFNEGVAVFMDAFQQHARIGYTTIFDFRIYLRSPYVDAFVDWLKKAHAAHELWMVGELPEDFVKHSPFADA